MIDFRRFIFGIGVATAMSLGASAATITVTISSVETWNICDQPFTISGRITTDSTQPASVFLDIRFDPAILEVVAVQPGSASIIGMKAVSYAMPNPGMLRLLIGGVNQGTIATGYLFFATFRCIAPDDVGTSPISTKLRLTSVSAADASAQRIVVAKRDGIITILPEGSTLPARGVPVLLTLILAILGLGLLCTHSRNKKSLLVMCVAVGASCNAWAAPPVAGDLTGDSIVSAEDLQRLVDSVLAGSSCPGADVDFSGEVDAVDYQLVVKAILGQSIDSDHDGLSDAAESELGTDPDRADTDGDGVNDGQEVSNGTDPLGLIPPSAVNDPGRSIWIEFTDPTKSHGLTVATAETIAEPIVVDGKQTWDIRRTDLVVAPWFTVSDVILTVEYYDCGEGQVGVWYDSLDLTQLNEPNNPGAWKSAAPIICTGTNTWRRAQVHLPDARFAQMDNNADVRFWEAQWVFPVSAIWITPVTEEPPVAACRTVEIMNPDGSIGSSHEPAADERYTLSTAQYELTFDARGLFSILDKTTGVRLAHPGPNHSIAEFRTQKNPLYYRTVQFATSDLPVRMRVFGGATPTAIEYLWGFEGSFHATGRIEKTDDETSKWQLDMSDRPESPPTLIWAQFPLFHGVAVGGNPTDDWFVCPSYAFHGAGIWHDLTTINTNLPPMAMNWLAVYDNDSGFGLFLDDPDSLDTFSPVYQETDAINLGLGFYERPTNQQAVYLQIPATDWHNVADAYRERVAAGAPSPQNPAWVSDCDGWDGWVGNEIERGFSFIPAYFQQSVLPRGLPLMDVYRAMYDGPWSYCGVYPYPNAYYGTPEELKEANLRVRDHGGRTIYYINYQLSTPDGPDVKRIGPTPRSFIPSDIPPPYAGQHGWTITGRSYTGLPSEQVIMDRSARSWSDRNLYWAKWYTEQLAVDGIYWDQLSCGRGGQKETAWNLDRITSECRALNPNFITASEGVNYAHGQTLTMGLASAVFHHNELYRYTYPDHLVIDGTANGATGWGGGDLRFNVIHLNGCRFDNLPSDPTFRQNTLALRKGVKQILYQASFRDTVGITLVLPSNEPPYPVTSGPQLVFPGGIQAKRFVLNTVDSALILVNTVNEHGTPDAEVKVDVSEVAPIRSAWAFLWGGDLQQIPFSTLSGGKVSFEVPTTMQATVVLVNRCEPLLYPETLSMASAGTSVATSATVLNLGSESMSGVVHWDVPAGWTATIPDLPTIGAGQSAQVTTSIAIASGAARQVHDLECIAETSLGNGRRYVGAPVVPSPYVDWRFGAGAEFAVKLSNLTTAPVSALVELVLEEGCGATMTPKQQAVGVPAKGVTEAIFTIQGRETMQQPTGMHIRVTCGGEVQDVPVRLFPTIANGSFEIDLAGDGKPEYWTSGDYSGRTQLDQTYPLFNLDGAVSYDGSSSLRIDPLTPPDEGNGVWAIPLATMLAPNSTYRVSCYVFIPPGGDIQLWFRGQHARIQTPAEDPVGVWRPCELVGVSGSEAYRTELIFCNSGNTPVWVDALSVKPVG